MQLTAENVMEVFHDCLYRDDEVEACKIPEGAVLVTGLVVEYGFHPDRVEKNSQAISEMLDQLPHQFRDGGGWTFLNACFNEAGEQWCEQPTAEALVVLGLAIKRVEYCLGRPVWDSLPGGVPYFRVKEAA